jgi:flavin-binding protein dodecin
VHVTTGGAERHASVEHAPAWGHTEEATVSVARVTEISAQSTKSFDDAIREGITKASKTLHNLKNAWVKEQEVLLDDSGKITGYRVDMKITFVMD